MLSRNHGDGTHDVSDGPLHRMRLLMLTMLPSLDLSPGQNALYGAASLFNMREAEQVKHTSNGPPPPLPPMSVPMLPKKLRKTAKRSMLEDRTWRPAAVKKAAVLNPAWVRDQRTQRTALFRADTI